MNCQRRADPGITRRHAGASLVEVVIVLVIIAILASMAAPSFRSYVQDTRTAALLNDFVSLLADVRSEAVTRRAPVVLCPSSDGFVCSGSWSDGWMAYIDLDNSGTRQAAKLKKGEACDPAVNECVVQHLRPPEGGPVVTNVDDHANIGFLATGFLNGRQETFELCIDGATGGRQVTIQASGQLTVAALDC